MYHEYMARIVIDSNGWQIKASIYPKKSPFRGRDGWGVMVSQRYYTTRGTWREDPYKGPDTKWFKSVDKALKAACDYLDRVERHRDAVAERQQNSVEVENCAT